MDGLGSTTIASHNSLYGEDDYSIVRTSSLTHFTNTKKSSIQYLDKFSFTVPLPYAYPTITGYWCAQCTLWKMKKLDVTKRVDDEGSEAVICGTSFMEEWMKSLEKARDPLLFAHLVMLTSVCNAPINVMPY